MQFITNITLNKYIAKVFSFIGLGPLTFGVYLEPDNIIIRAKTMKNILNNYSRQVPYNKVIIIILKESLKFLQKSNHCIFKKYFISNLPNKNNSILIEKFIFIKFLLFN